jgi:carbon-monoxide dehydrogenase iron sulfur subunit
VRRIYCRIENCLACRACEIACAVAHSESKNLADAIREVTAPKHRITVRVFDNEGTLTRTRAIAVQCRHCDDPPCVEACTEGCIHRNETTGEVFIDHESCSGCWVCIKACPYGAIIRHRGLQTALLCDHCPDREVPACVEACRTRALTYCEREETDTDYAELFKERES